MILNVAPNFERAGVVAGFVLTYLQVPCITKGVLFAQGTMYRPAGDWENLSMPPLNAQSWLFYNSISGFYWQAEACPTAADDAFLGWILTDATHIVAVSRQLVEVPDPTGPAPRVVPLGPVMPAEPGGGAHGDTGVPGEVTCNWRLAKPGHVDLCELEPTSNRHSIRNITLGVAYRDQTGAAAGALTADAGAADTIFAVDDGTKFQIGWVYLIDRECVYVDAIEGDNVTVQRAVFGTTAAAHFGPKAITGATDATPIVVSCAGHGRAADDAVWVSSVAGNTAANGGWMVGNLPSAGSFALYGSSGNGAYGGGGTVGGSRLYEVVWNVSVFTFEPEFFDGEDAASWSASIALPNALICALTSVAVNAFGVGASWTGERLDSWQRTSFGGQILLTAEGVLGIESDLVPPVTVQSGVAVRWVLAGVKAAPDGGKIVAAIKADGVMWATVTIPDGETQAAALDGLALAPLAAGAVLSMDITSVGLTFPGERLGVTISL